MRNPDGWGDRESWRYTKKISTLDEFLCAMSPQQWNVSAEMIFMGRKGLGDSIVAAPHDKAYVNISQDCNYYVDGKSYELDPRVAEAAVSYGYVKGVPKWGYTSKHEWVITEDGRIAALEARKRFEEYEKTTKLEPLDCVQADEGEG